MKGNGRLVHVYVPTLVYWKANPLANAVNAIDTYVTGHDTYGVQHTKTEPTIQLATVIPIGRIAPVMGMAEKELLTKDGLFLRKSAQFPKLLQRGGNFQRIVNTGRPIGIDATTGQETWFFTIITNKLGEIVTALPGLPGR